MEGNVLVKGERGWHWVEESHMSWLNVGLGWEMKSRIQVGELVQGFKREVAEICFDVS